ncbi:hypothetical protein SLS62_002620 [Diatrype stigma]|uniref:MOZ protein represents a chromatin-associated acetyltransferase n=1 Tax=Diatrype stigma TaxID=117547 RepID=A0AAN9V8C7_9PEZI
MLSSLATMSTARLTFLYPHLFRSARLAESATQITNTRCRKPSGQHRQYATAFSPSPSTRHAVFERHGKAVEPAPATSKPTPDDLKLPQPDKKAQPPKDPWGSKNPKVSKTPPQAPAPGIGGKFEAKEGGQDKTATKETATRETGKTNNAPNQPEKKDAESPSPPTEAPAQAGRQASQVLQAEEQMRTSGPMEVVLHMPPPGSAHSPHLSMPRYMHHFDTYTLVKQLEKEGYTKEQAITLMKAVRVMLGQNLDVAQEGLVSKRDVDNETYLFNAACSELSAEVTNNRRIADENTRQQRTHLQHEVDILNQRMSQDLQTLKDDVKGMFNDRKMTVREEQRTMESQIQQINLKISVLLNSDAKSDIESLRWILIRRSAVGILFMAFMTLATLRYASYVGQRRKREAEEQARQAERLRLNGGKEDHAPPVDAARILAAN